MKYLIYFVQDDSTMHYADSLDKYGPSHEAGWTTDITKAYRFDLDAAIEAYRERTLIVTNRIKDGYEVVLTRDMRDISESAPIETPPSVPKESWFDRLESK